MSKGDGLKAVTQGMGITRTVERPREESDIQLREDRIGKYFKKYLNKFIFTEFSEEFMKESEAGELMRGVPIPLRKKEVKDFEGGKGIAMLVLAENMAWVMGCDPHFKYVKDYVAILKKLYNHKLWEGMLREGRDAAERGEMDFACIHFRASLCMQFDYLHGMYSYARACRAMYNNSSNEEYVGRFKAEALDWFELVTETHPRFAQGYYFLGYTYLNMGLYTKADLAWQNFMRFSRNGKEKKEITKRRKQIQDPMKIEAGCNEVMAGRYDGGLDILEPYMSSQFNDWWPLHYYLGVAYEKIGMRPEAVNSLKKALQLNGSQLETMKELLAIYEDEGDKENIKKYSEKIELVEEAMEADRKKNLKAIEKEDKRLQLEESKLTKPEKIDIEDEDDTESDGASTLEDMADEIEEKDGEDGASAGEKKRLVKRLGEKN